MSARRLIVLAVAVAALPACSLAYDGGRYRGGASGEDAGTDAGPGPDLCDAARVIACEDMGEVCDPATGDCTDCLDSVCVALDPDFPYCDAAGDGFCVECREAAHCEEGDVCDEDGFCLDCDDDDDGFPSSAAECAGAMPAIPRDCDDTNAAIHPGAVPICNNGIDESCSGGSVAGGLAVEAGLFRPFTVEVPPGVDRPSQLRVFALDASTALVFFQAGDSARTPRYAEVTLGGDDVVSEDLEAALGGVSLPDGGSLRADAIQQPNGRVVAAFMGGEGPQYEIVHAAFDRTARTWSPLLGTVSHMPGTVGHAGFSPTGSPALLQRGAQFFFAVPATTTAVSAPQLFAIGVDNSHFEAVTRASTVAGGRPWVESGAMAVGYPDASGNVRFWTGRTGILEGDDGTVQGNVASLGGGVPAQAAVRTVRGGGSSFNRVAFVVPSPTGLEAFTMGCTDDVPLHECTTFAAGPDSPATYARPLGDDPRIAAALLSSTALGVVMTSVEPGGARTLRLGILETGPLSSSILAFPLAVPTDGMLFDLAMDADLTPDTTTPNPDDGMSTFMVAWASEVGAARRIRIGGIRSCIGYAGP